MLPQGKADLPGPATVLFVSTHKPLKIRRFDPALPAGTVLAFSCSSDFKTGVFTVRYANLTLFSGLVLSGLLAFGQVQANECDDGLEAGCGTQTMTIQPRYSLNTGDWYPLSEETMKSAVLDTAMANLSDSGFFTFNQGAVSQGLMDFHITLVGAAKAIKLTITLQVPDYPTFIATTSMSVKSLDREGIYQALEQIGEQSALRMLDKLEAYLAQIDKPAFRHENTAALEHFYQRNRGIGGRSYMLSYAASRLNRLSGHPD